MVGMPDKRLWYRSKLENERELYMKLQVPDLDNKRPYYDVLEGKPFTFTTEESRVRIQINLLMNSLKSGDSFELWRSPGHKWALRLHILHRSLISIGVLHTSQLVLCS